MAYFGSLAGLANNALKEGLDKTCHKYLLLLSKLLSIVFAHSDTHPELASTQAVTQTRAWRYSTLCQSLRTRS